MGLSVAISGGIMIVAFAMVMMMLPSIVNNIFSVQQVSSTVSENNEKIANTDISTRRLETQIGSPRVNFTLVNQGSQSLWKFDSFNVYVEYEGGGTSKRTEELTYGGKCSGGVPQPRKWCIETITNDFKDPDILNLGEGARIRTTLSQNLATTNAVITVVTDNGVTNTSGYDFTVDITTLETLTNVTSTGCALNQIIKVNSTGYWACSDPEITVLQADVVCAATAPAYCTVFTIPLTASQGNFIEVNMMGDSNTAGSAIQFRAIYDNAGNTGWCNHRTFTTATAEVLDNLLISTVTADTGETTWLAAANAPMPLKMDCAIEGDATPGNLLIQVQMEVASTGTIQAGSNYIKTP